MTMLLVSSGCACLYSGYSSSRDFTADRSAFDIQPMAT
jgi:hypothetical protein